MAEEPDRDGAETPGPRDRYEKPAVSWEEAIDGHASLMQGCSKTEGSGCDPGEGLSS